ncbi:hypothetical protein QNI19_18890 [Cytophagaceae bacterium DM2B3-1]|uniref:Lipoprotein n=1 Tax=Xanthocytophaga flava TaxID=3048013 RepID=A0ABT7CMT8_9BACT|nr:hypothetical protein [Xanthocytophaga flavus]MDJ1495013.1 hypothetical protein [Xanthocytophaga flavus]
MKKYVLFALYGSLMVSIYGCIQKETNVSCKGIHLERVYAERTGRNDKTFYIHYILLRNYNENCFEFINFTNRTKRYIDSCSSYRPITRVVFLSSTEDVGFEIRELDPEKIAKYEVISFDVDFNSISAIRFVKNGFRKEFRIKGGQIEEH